MTEPNGNLHRRREDQSTLAALNHLYERWRILFIPIVFFFIGMAYRWVKTVEKQLAMQGSALETLVRIKCVELDDRQISTTNLDCSQILRRPLPPPYGPASQPIAPTTPGGTSPP